jgi:hypothetical protein
MATTLVPDVEKSPVEIRDEIQTFAQNYPTIRRKGLGKFVLIQASTVVDYFKSYTEAMRAGYEMFGSGNFFVRQIKEKEAPVNVMRCGVKRVTGPLKLAN